MVARSIFRKPQPARDSSVLLIDNDSATVILVSKLLEDQKYVVHVASSGEEAFSFLSEAALPDAFIVDFTLPDMNGQQFIEQARLRFGRAVLPPVLLLTAADGGEATANSLQVEDYLPKPFDNDSFLQHMERLFASVRSDNKT